MNTSTIPSVDGGAASDVADDFGPDLDRTSTRLSDPSATEDGRAKVSGDNAHQSDAAPVSALSWLGAAVVDGLVHCACSHHAVHPDLMTFATSDIPS